MTIGTTRMVSFVCLCFLLLLIVANCQKTHPQEVKALKSIKKSLNDPRKNLENWKNGDPCTSNWTGIVCYDKDDDGYFHIKELMLLEKNLSGSLSPKLGLLSRLMIMDFMRNDISGTIPKEIGSIASLELLLLSGNQLSGVLPEELGGLSNLNRIQIDENQISGSIPLSFANLTRAKHFHMNNNSLSGEIPPQLSRLPILVHLLLDNNNLSGNIPAELSELPNLLILQLDNNNFNGSILPSSYSNMTQLVKLSLRNCSLQGGIPDWSQIPNISYIDLSMNQLSGPIPTGGLSGNITTIDLSNNNLNGTIPESFSSLPNIQKLSVANNSLVGLIPSIIWQNRRLNQSERLIVNFENNGFLNVTGSLLVPPNVTIGLQGNPACSNTSLTQLCGLHEDTFTSLIETNLKNCPQSCPVPYEYAPPSPEVHCFCAAPLYITYRMKSPAFSDFIPYLNSFQNYLSSGLGLDLYQLDIHSAIWQIGPRLEVKLKIFPLFVVNRKPEFNNSEILRIRGLFSGWKIRENHFFGPFELLSFTTSDAYREFLPQSSSGVSKGAVAGIVLGSLVGSVALTVFLVLVIFRKRADKLGQISNRRPSSRKPIKIDGVKDFSYSELALATNNFSSSSLVGEGGYGKVYRGILADGTDAAIKRAQEGSLQGEKEFLTEIELLSRLHHINLVALIGYCDEETEQMLVYEYMPNGTLRDLLSGKFKAAMSFAMRVRTALGAARGILYLHTEADPPIFHRDIKASNILMDSKYTAKVADFGLSRLATASELEGDVPSHVSTVVKGTPGYLDPEYFLTHQLTDRSDVYSLGVVFMELLTGLPPISHGKNIVREVNIAYKTGIILSMIDQEMGPYPSECVQKFLNLALKCCKDETNERPSMAQVVRELENIWTMIPETDRDTEMIIRETFPGKVVSFLPSSSSFVSASYVSDDVSGSDLVSGVAHAFSPR